MINLISKSGKLLIGMLIGTGLGFFLLSGITGGFLGDPIGHSGLVAFILGVAWFLRERKKIGFGSSVSVFTLVLMPIATFPLYITLSQSLVIFLQASAQDLALMFIGSGFFAVSLAGIYAKKKPEQLGFSFMILSLLFLICVPIINEYQIIVSRHGFYWIATPYEGYTIPFILASIAFFALSWASILFVKSGQSWQNSNEANQIEQDNVKQNSISAEQKELNEIRKSTITSNGLGLSSLVLSSLCLIGAAVVYAPMGPSPTSYSVPGTPLEGYALAFVLASAGFFVFGLALMLYQKSKKLGFFSAALASLFLFSAAFADGYKARITEVVFDDVKVVRFVNPYREYALPIVLVSVVFLALSFPSMSRAKSKTIAFFWALSTSLAFIGSAFAYGYSTQISEGNVPGEMFLRIVYPYRDYAVPTVLASILLVLGYLFAFRKSWVVNEIKGVAAKWSFPNNSRPLGFITIFGTGFLLVGAIAETVTVFHANAVLRFIAGPFSIVGIGFLVTGFAGKWSMGRKTNGTFAKALVAGLVLLTLTLAVGYSYAKTMEPVVPPSIFEREKVTIGQITFDSVNSNTLFVNVTKTSGGNESITFSNALIKNGSGDIVANIDLDSFIMQGPVLTERTLAINVNTSLASGKYTVTLVTTRGSAFVSPSFTVP